MLGQSTRLFSGTIFVSAAVVALGVSTSAIADSINIFGDTDNSTEGLADFSGMLTYDFVLGDMGELTVDLTNTTIFDEGGDDDGGFLTGFIFNVGSTDEGVWAVLTSTTNESFLDAPSQSGNPFGSSFVGGAALGGNWLGGGNPENGLEVGESGTFTFDIMAEDADSLSAASFLQGPYEFDFVVRFRGLGDDDDGLSDKVPAVPAPGALALLGLGAFAQRKRRRTA